MALRRPKNSTAGTEDTSNSGDTALSAKKIKLRYEKALRATLYERYEYWINYAFLRGRQWVYWNRITKRIDNVPRTRGRYQATIDRLSPSSRTLISKLVERPLNFEVPPSGADDDSVMGAQTGESILLCATRDHGWEELREDLAWAAWTGGTAAICVDWDVDGGYEVPSEEDEDLHSGDTCETALTIAEFVVEPGARKAAFARYWIKALIYPPEEVQSMYPDAFPDGPPPADAQSSQSPYNQRVITTNDQALNMIDGTVVLTYYERPNALNKKGSVAVVVDNQIVDQKDWPFPWTERLNLAVIRETPVNGRWTGETVLSKATNVQTALNAAWSNYLEHLKKVGNARLILPASQMDSADSLNDDPGRPLKFLDGPGATLPQYLSPPQLPPWMSELISMLQGEMDTILGVSDVARGMAPSNAPDSGYGFQILSNNSDTPTGRLSNEMARAFGEVGTMVLKLYADNVDETHKAVIHTPKNPPMTVDWTGKSLSGQTTAVVPVNSIMPRSHAEIMQMAQSFIQNGMIQPGDFATFARVAEMPGFEDALEAVDYQTALAMRYCHLLAEGVVPEPKSWHDPQVMIHEINRFRCSPRYEQLSPKIQDLYEHMAQAYQQLGIEATANRYRQTMVNPALAQTPVTTGTAPGLPGVTAPPAQPMPGGGPQQAPAGPTPTPQQQPTMQPVGG